MVDYAGAVALVGYALGALGGVLLFMEFFQLPSYVEYRAEYKYYNVSLSPNEVDEYTWIGRTGALLVALAFALQFLAALLP